MKIRTKLLLAAVMWGALLGMMIAPRAHAADAMIGVASDPSGARVVLMPAAGPCTGHARQALHVAADGQRTPGCWIMTPGAIHVAWFDGEMGRIPVADIHWAKGI